MDSSGLKVVGEKEWIAYKYGTRERKIWRKLHIGVTDDGTIIAAEITTLRESDIAVAPPLLSQINEEVYQVTGDGAYHKKNMEKHIYPSGLKNWLRKASGILRAHLSYISCARSPIDLRSSSPNNLGISENPNTARAKFVGPPGHGRTNYGNRLKIEETFSRYKRIIGNIFKAKDFLGQVNEAKISLLILNKMKDIGMPVTIRVA